MIAIQKEQGMSGGYFLLWHYEIPKDHPQQ
jgi:hypothetical protein